MSLYDHLPPCSQLFHAAITNRRKPGPGKPIPHSLLVSLLFIYSPLVAMEFSNRGRVIKLWAASLLKSDIEQKGNAKINTEQTLIKRCEIFNDCLKQKEKKRSYVWWEVLTEYEERERNKNIIIFPAIFLSRLNRYLARESSVGQGTYAKKKKRKYPKKRREKETEKRKSFVWTPGIMFEDFYSQRTSGIMEMSCHLQS